MTAAAAPLFRAEGFVDARLDARVLKVLPGECRALRCRGGAGQPVLATTLGSCVSACLFEEGSRGIGGMNHFLLPQGGGNDTARYGVHAMELLINALLKLGARRDLLRAKVFGGGAVLAAVTSINVGQQNAAFVKRFLATERIPVLAEDLLGLQPRKVLFFPATGEARVRRLPIAAGNGLADQERQLQQRMREPAAAPNVELF